MRGPEKSIGPAKSNSIGMLSNISVAFNKQKCYVELIYLIFFYSLFNLIYNFAPFFNHFSDIIH